MKKKIIMLLIFALLFGVITACGNSSSKAEASSDSINKEVVGETEETVNVFVGEGLNEAAVIKIGYQVSIFNVYNVEQEKHWVEEEFAGDGIKVEWIEFSYGVPLVEAITAGEIDIATALGDTPFINAYANGADIIAVYTTPKDPYALALVAAPDDADAITSVADLEGKKVAYAAGSASQDFIVRELGSAGLTEKDIEALNISSTSDLQTALVTGEADAAVIYEPNGTIVADTIGGALINYEGVKKSVGVSVANRLFAESNPELLARFIKQEKRYEQYIAENVDEYVSIVAATTGFPEYVIKQIVERYEYQEGFQEYHAEALRETIEFMVGADLLEETIDITDGYTNIYYDEAIRLLTEDNT